MSTTKAKTTVKPSQLPLAAWAPSMCSYSAEREVLLRSGGRAELGRGSRPKGGEKLDARRGPSWNGRSENDWEGGNAALATFDEKPPWPGAAVSNIGGGAFFLKERRRAWFDAASYDGAVWAGLGKGDQAGARRSPGIVSDPRDSCYPCVSSRRSEVVHA